MTSFYKNIYLFFSLLLLVVSSSCSNEIESEPINNSLVTVNLKASSSNFNEVNIEVLDIQFRIMEDENNPAAWQSLNTINTGVLDLGTLSRTDVITLVDFEEIESSFVYEIRLVLGNNNTAVMNEVSYSLSMPMGMPSECNNIINKQLTANVLYEFVVEFEVEKSIELMPDGDAQLTPKINTLMRTMNIL